MDPLPPDAPRDRADPARDGRDVHVVTRWTGQAEAPTGGTGTGTGPVGGDIFEFLFDHPGRVPDMIDYRLSRDDVQRRMARVRTSVVADPPATVGQDDPKPGGGFLALPQPIGPPPKPGDLVSLKVRTADTGGSIVEETVKRAWAEWLAVSAGGSSP